MRFISNFSPWYLSIFSFCVFMMLCLISYPYRRSFPTYGLLHHSPWVARVGAHTTCWRFLIHTSCQLTQRATLFRLFWYSFWASLEDSLVIYMIVSVFIPQSLHNEVSDVLFVLNLMEYVLNACCWAASITHTIFFLRSSFLATFTSVPIFYVGLLNSPSKSFSCNYFSFLGKLFSCIIQDSPPPEVLFHC